MKKLKKIRLPKLTRPQQIVRNVLLIVLAAMVLSWVWGPKETVFKSSDELLEYELMQLGINQPYDVIADYTFGTDTGYRHDRQVFVKSNIFEDEVYVCVSMKQASKKWEKSRQTSVSELNGTERINWFYIGDYFGNNWSYTSFDTNYIKELCGGSGYSKMTVDGNIVTIELDFINDYGNSMDGEHLKNFQPELIYNYDIETGKAGLTGIRALCAEKDMVLSDKQAAEIAELHINSKEYFMKAAEENGMTGEKIFEHVYN